MSVQALRLVLAKFNGRNSSGAITVTGLRVGDRMCLWFGSQVTLGALLPSGTNGPANYLEPVVTVDDQIQQGSNDDLTGTSFEILFLGANGQ